MPLDALTYVTIQMRGQNIAANSAVAYWDDEHRDFMHKNLMEEFRELAKLLGFDLVERPTEQPQQIAAE